MKGERGRRGLWRVEEGSGEARDKAIWGEKGRERRPGEGGEKEEERCNKEGKGGRKERIVRFIIVYVCVCLCVCVCVCV